jgi:hypothetical protein
MNPMTDFTKRLNFCSWVQQQPPDFHERLIMSDESKFCISQPANPQNHRENGIRGQQNPTFYFTRDVSKTGVMLWAGLIGINFNFKEKFIID